MFAVDIGDDVDDWFFGFWDGCVCAALSSVEGSLRRVDNVVLLPFKEALAVVQFAFVPRCSDGVDEFGEFSGDCLWEIEKFLLTIDWIGDSLFEISLMFLEEAQAFVEEVEHIESYNIRYGTITQLSRKVKQKVDNRPLFPFLYRFRAFLK